MGGRVGKYIIEELVKTGKHKLSAITRADSMSKVPVGVEVKKVDYDDHASLYVYLESLPPCADSDSRLKDLIWE